MDRAKEANDEDTLETLSEIGPPVNGYYTGGRDGLVEQRKILGEYGGAAHDPEQLTSYMNEMIFADEYSLWDSVRYIRGIFFTLDAFMPVYNKVDLFKEVPEIRVPLYVLTGRYDYQTPFVLAEEYFDRLRAPLKKWIWFEDSAHMQIYEESQKYMDTMVRTVCKECEDIQ